MADSLELNEETIEQIAQRVATLLADNRSKDRCYVDAATLADEYSVERDWVYSHAEQLGAIRLGGPNGRLRFARIRVREILGSIRDAPTPHPSKRRHAQRLGSTQTQRRASGRTPARSPKRHQTGGSPDDEA